MEDIKRIIYGKAGIERIVSIEPADNSVELFIEEADGTIRSEFKPHKYWLLSHTPLTREFIRLHGELYYKYGRQYESREEFLKDRGRYRNDDIYSIYSAKEACAVKDGYSSYLGMEVNEVSLLSFDIETTGLDETAEDAKILMISTFYRNSKSTQTRLFSFDQYEDQGQMLKDFCNYVQQKDPSILLGHNIFGFDLRYMKAIADRENVQLELGRDGSAAKFDTYEKKFRVDGSRDLPYKDVRVYGRELIDSMMLAIRSDIGRKYNSYGLKSIIEQEGWTQKGRVFYDASQIRKNYLIPEELEKIKEYCRFDALDAVTLYDNFIPPFFYMNMSVSKGSFQTLIQTASGSQLNSIMCRAYLQDAHSLPKATDSQNFEGALSEGYAGIYSNVNKLDIASLYPSIMVEYDIGPGMLKDPKCYFNFLVKYFRDERLRNKKLAKETGDKKYTHLEQSEKIFINSLYGFMGSTGLLFNNPEGAAEVTRRGREILTKGIEFCKENGYIITNIDTDSFSYGKQDGSFISEEERESFRQNLNALYPKNISWEPDGYFTKFIVLRAKNYVLYDGKKIKYKGSALRNPALEPALKEFINRIVESIIYETGNCQEIYNEYVKEIQNVKDIKRWSCRKTLTSKTYNSERANETKIKDAVEETEYVEGDRVHVFYLPDGSLCLSEEYQGIYDKEKLLEKLFKAGQRFSPIFSNSKELFPNYKLKKNKKALEVLTVAA